MKVYYSPLKLEQGSLVLAATEKGLCWVGEWHKVDSEMKQSFRKKNPASVFIKSDEKLIDYKMEFQAYFSGSLQTFSIPLDLRGTSFQESVWKELQAIPFGETRSYSDIAERIGRPAAIRAVGTAIGKNPVLIAVPCHRVIQKSGKLGGFRAGLPFKKALLHHEQNI